MFGARTSRLIVTAAAAENPPVPPRPKHWSALRPALPLSIALSRIAAKLLILLASSLDATSEREARECLHGRCSETGTRRCSAVRFRIYVFAPGAGRCAAPQQPLHGSSTAPGVLFDDPRHCPTHGRSVGFLERPCGCPALVVDRLLRAAMPARQCRCGSRRGPKRPRVGRVWLYDSQGLQSEMVRPVPCAHRTTSARHARVCSADYSLLRLSSSHEKS